MGRIHSINRELRKYDRDLFAIARHDRVDICRRVDSLHKSFRMVEEMPPESQYLFSLTDDWKNTGSPVDLGLELLREHLNSLDAWRDDSFFKTIQENRVREQELSRKRFKNEVRARAYDIRSDFAKATNDLRLGASA